MAKMSNQESKESSTKQQIAYLIVNFGGPRDLTEVEEFLIALLTDKEVIQTPFPQVLHQWLFTRVAKKRARSVVNDYEAIGGGSPIFKDTEAIKEWLQKELDAPVLTFHRYLPKTHREFIEEMKQLKEVQKIHLLPLFPQFSYATTGSIALWFLKHLPKQIVNKLNWITSYPDHPAYIKAFEGVIREALKENQWKEEETLLLCSAHGLPKSYVEKGDCYERECQLTFQELKKRFPEALFILCYQSQFGKKEWLRPYTNDVCSHIQQFANHKKNVLVVPLSFTSDHIETLFEVEELYLPVIRAQGFEAKRCPALNLNEEWLLSLLEIMKGEGGAKNADLIRKKGLFF